MLSDTAPGHIAPREGQRSLSRVPASIVIIAYYVFYFLFVPLSSRQLGASLPIDEIAAVLFAPLGFVGLLRLLGRSKIFTLSTVGYFIFLASSSIIRLLSVRGYPTLAPILGIILDAKPFVFIFFFYALLYRKPAKLRYRTERVMAAFLALALFNSFFDLIDITNGHESIWGIPLLHGNLGFASPNGLFTHKYGSAILTMMGALSALGLMRERMSFLRVSSFIYLTLLLAGHSAAKEVIATLIAAVIFIVLPARQANKHGAGGRMIMTVLIVGLVATATLLARDTLASRYDIYTQQTVRSELYTASVLIARDEFPLGSGSGTFASEPSRNTYFSPLYDKYGISAMYGARRGQSDYLMDVWWPHVVAEAGFIGLALYLIPMLLVLWWSLVSYWKSRKGYALFLMTSTLAILINSFAAATFTADAVLPVIGFVWAAVLVDRPRKRKSHIRHSIGVEPGLSSNEEKHAWA